MISVIIPVFNVEDYLKECLDSVVNQTFRDIEIICVNDGSTDKSLSILEEYQKRDSRITIISQSNRGLSGARNSGLRFATGKYTYFLDSDDYMELTALDDLYTLCEEKNLDMALFKTCCFYDETKQNFTSDYFEMDSLKNLVGGTVFNHKDIGKELYSLPVTMGSTFFRTELISDITFPEGLIFEDNPFFIESLLNARRVFFYEKYLYHKREREGSITTANTKKFSDIIVIRNMIIDLARRHDAFSGILYLKKLNIIKFRFLQTSDEYKPDFFNKIQEDFLEYKESYENDELFLKLPEHIKNIFYAGLNSKNYQEFEKQISI